MTYLKGVIENSDCMVFLGGGGLELGGKSISVCNFITLRIVCYILLVVVKFLLSLPNHNQC